MVQLKCTCWVSTWERLERLLGSITLLLKLVVAAMMNKCRKKKKKKEKEKFLCCCKIYHRANGNTYQCSLSWACSITRENKLLGRRGKKSYMENYTDMSNRRFLSAWSTLPLRVAMDRLVEALDRRWLYLIFWRGMECLRKPWKKGLPCREARCWMCLNGHFLPNLMWCRCPQKKLLSRCECYTDLNCYNQI